jgi:hypothetical protein
VVTATNTGGSGAADSGSDTVYNNGWAGTDNGGYGWGAWQFQTSSRTRNKNGRFMATSADVNIGTPAWGLYANSGHLSEARRLMTNVLAVGESVSVQLDNGYIDPNGRGIGVAHAERVRHDAVGVLLQRRRHVLQHQRRHHGCGVDLGGPGCEFTLTTATSYLARIAPHGGNTRTNVGALNVAASQEISAFRAWNYSAGTNSSYDFFFNSLNRSGGAGGTTSVLVSIVRPASDGQIPQAGATATTAHRPELGRPRGQGWRRAQQPG